MSSLDHLNGYMDKTVRVCVSGGRLFEGTLCCVDKGLNIILSDSLEIQGAETGKRVIHFSSHHLDIV